MVRFMRASNAAAIVLAALSGCASVQLSGSDLDNVSRPAFISRIEEGAGPRAEVFQDDPAYGGKLKKLEPKEADRRLQVKLTQAVSRFEVSDRLRATTLAKLPREAPWTNVVDAAQVASVLESFLVEEVPANPPDYELLRPLGADAVVEFVIQRYGMRSTGAHAGAFVEGYGRMFRLDGPTLWRRPFRMDGIDLGRPHLDPFRVGKDPELFRKELTSMLDAVADAFAKDLSPQRRRVEPRVKKGSEKGSGELQSEGDDIHKAGRDDRPHLQELPPGELPDPDPLPQPAKGTSDAATATEPSSSPAAEPPAQP